MDGVHASCPRGQSRIDFLYGEDRRWVQVGSIYGLAYAYTRELVYVEWTSALGGLMTDWFPAAGVHTVPDDEWHGLPFVD